MSDQLVLILVIIGGAIGLFLVAIAMWMMRSETPAGPKPEATAVPVEPQPAPEPAPASESEASPSAVPEPVASSPIDTLPPAPSLPISATPPPPPPASPNAPSLTASIGSEDLMRVWRSVEGELAIEVNGRRYRTRQELIDAGLEGLVASAVQDLNRLVAGPAGASIPTITAAAHNPANGGDASAPTTARPITKVSLEEASKMAIKRPTMDIPKQFRYLREQQKQPEIQIKTIAEEIDEILQSQIADTLLKGRGLKVADSVQGVSFSIDGRNYESVDSIPDGDARNAIRIAIQKWDQK